MSTPDFSHELIDQLGDAATTIDPGDGTAALVEVRHTATRRGRRRRVVMGVAAAGALVAGGAVAATLTSSNGDDKIVSSPAPDETEPASTEEIQEEDAATTPTSDAELGDSSPPPAGRPLPVMASRAEAITDDGLVINEQNSAGAQLYPWKGGFLAVHSEYPEQLPTDLPPEVAEKFPQEVLDLFPDGLPPTLDEAMVILEEAGLDNIVSDIVLNDPEVSEGYYGEQPEPVTTLRFSEDGVEWSEIESDFPVALDSFPTLASSGERLALVSPVTDGIDAVDDPSENITAVEVWSSTDLLSWERQEIALPSRPPDLPDFVRAGTSVHSIAANDDAWVVSLTRYTHVDAFSLLDDEQRAAAISAEGGGHSQSVNETGVRVEIHGDGPEPGLAETIEFTWDELGIDEPPNEENETLSYTAPWGGDAQRTEIGVDGQHGLVQTLALDSGFVAFGSELLLSSDGVRWSSVQLPDGGIVDWVIETDARLIVSGSNNQGTSFRLLFDPASSEFSPIDLAGVPETGWAQHRARKGVVVNDYGEDQFDPSGSFGSAGVVEMDGYLFELEARFTEEVNSVSYVLTDVATGEVVSTEAFDPSESGSTEFEFAKEVSDVPDDLEGFRVFDPESGEVLIEAPMSEIDFVELDADGEPIPESEFQLPVVEVSEVVGDDGPQTPDSWLIASVGDSLIIEQIEGSNGDTYLTSVAVQGDVVMVVGNDGIMTRIVAEG